MKTMKMKFGTVALVACAVLWAVPAHADLISIAVAEDGGSPMTVVTGNGSATIGPTTIGDFMFSATGLGTPPLTEPNLRTSTVDVETTGMGTHTFTVWITEQGLSSPTGVNPFLSTFTSNAQSANMVAESTLISTADALFTGTTLASATFGPNPLLQTASSINNTPSLAAPYSETAEYVITTNAVWPKC